MNRKYSFLMSIYEKENPLYFRESIESIKNQTIPPDEIVIVKDGPLNPELDNVIYEYVKHNPIMFTVVPIETNIGLGPALNEGLKKCRNELVARMDTDDISKPERIEKQLKRFDSDDELVLLGSYIDEFIDDTGNVISSRIVPSEHKDILKFSRRRNPFNHPTVMYKKSKVLEVGGYGDFRRNQDLDLFVRMLLNGNKAANIEESLLYFRANNENLKRRKSWEKCSNYIEIIKKFRKMGHSSIIDLWIITLSQIFVFMAPDFVMKILSDKYLRKKPQR